MVMLLSRVAALLLLVMSIVASANAQAPTPGGLRPASDRQLAPDFDLADANGERIVGLSGLGVAMDEDGWKSVTPYLNEHPVNYTIVTGDMAIAKRYNVTALPVTVLIDRNGKIAAMHVGVVLLQRQRDGANTTISVDTQVTRRPRTTEPRLDVAERLFPSIAKIDLDQYVAFH
jgi:hypothetical protein